MAAVAKRLGKDVVALDRKSPDCATGVELKATDRRLRAEFRAELEAEVLKLRSEFLQDRLDVECSAKRLKPVPPPALIACDGRP